MCQIFVELKELKKKTRVEEGNLKMNMTVHVKLKNIRIEEKLICLFNCVICLRCYFQENMTPAHTDSPLRRSEAFREGQQNVTINDDDEERRQARRRTILAGNSTAESTTFEDNETLKKCLEIYNGNKLSKENAWSLSLIDTLTTLLDRHHKSLNNFKVRKFINTIYQLKFLQSCPAFVILIGCWFFFGGFFKSL